jgi:hypothetical protein
MYYDDHLDPTLENDYDDVSIGGGSIACSIPTIEPTYKKKSQKAYDDFAKLDKHYHIMKRFINNKVVNIGIYETPLMPGSIIRDAIYGSKQHYRVGGNDESLYFKVKFSTGEEGLGSESRNYFFDSPEQYEKHTGSVVPQESKEAWAKKNMEERIKRMK